MFKFILVSIMMFCTSAFAEAEPGFFESLGSRSEYTNQGLLNGINYNVWVYRAVSFGTSWNGPENSLERIRQRADRSPEDAQELLLGLSAILKDSKPAGDYILDLYQHLLNKSQDEVAMPLSIFKQILSDRGYTDSRSLPLHTENLNDVDSRLLIFISNSLKVPSFDLNSEDDFLVFDTLLQAYLSVAIGAKSTSSLGEMTRLVIASGSENRKIVVSNKIHSISANPIYISRSNSELTSIGKSVIGFRDDIVNSLDEEVRFSVAMEKVRSYVLFGGNLEAYFNYKKIENDLLIIELLGGEEALMLIADKIQQIVDLLEAIDKEISRSLTRISLSVGYSSGSTTGYVSSSYRGGSGRGGVSSSQAASVLRNVRLRANVFDELQETVESAIRMCQTALEANDEEVLRACANDLVSRFLATAEETSRRDASDYLNRKVDEILAITSDYFDPINFTTTCSEVDLEQGLLDVQSVLPEIEELKVRISENTRFQTAYGEINTNITHFKYVDCTKSEYAVLVTPRNMTFEFRQGDNIGFNGVNNYYNNPFDYGYSWGSGLANVFFADSNTVAACLEPLDGQMNVQISEEAYEGRLTSRSVGLYNYLLSVDHKYWDTLGRYSRSTRGYEDNETDVELTDDEESFKRFFNTQESNYYRKNPVFMRGWTLSNSNNVSGALLPDISKKICISQNSDSQNVNCTERSGEVVCKENSLFSVSFAPKENEGNQ